MGMSLEDYLRFVKHIEIEEFDRLPFEYQMALEMEYARCS